MKSTMAREPHMDWKAVFTNANMIAIFIGLILLFTGWRMPEPVNDAFHALGLVIGPSAMIIAGMLLGNMSWEKIKSYKRVPLVAFLRLIVMPLMVPSFIICIFLSITRCFMTYDVNLALTEGNPFGSTVMAAMFVYRKAFSDKNYGLGQTEAIMLFVVCAIVSLLQVYFTKRKEIEA